MKKNSILDVSSSVVLLVTLLLFVMALFTQGMTHDLLLEAGVFLVSVKIFIYQHKNEEKQKGLEQKIDSLLQEIRALKK